MGRKIFISYKYGDTSVQHLDRNGFWDVTKVRDYVDELQSKLSSTDHLNKGELDGEDLSQFKDESIASKLRDKIYDSSVTIVLISPKMKDCGILEENQWIPWEISYSLKEVRRKDRISRTNGVLAVVLPDKNGQYEYMLESKKCCTPTCTLWHTNSLFTILKNNMFNKKVKDRNCKCACDTAYIGYPSYIHMIRWDEFISNINTYIELAIKIRDNKDDYNILKTL